MRHRQSSFVSLALGAALALIAGCADTPSTESDSPTANASAETTGEAAVREENRNLDVPAGSVLTVEFRDTVSSAQNRTGDRFHATVVEPVYVGSKVAIDSGASVRGQVVEVVPAKKIGGKAQLRIEFTTLELVSGEQVPIGASFRDEGKGQTKKDAATIGGATAGGAILGRVIGHQNDNDAEGTTIGAIVGAAVGTAIAATNERDEVVIPAGTVLSIELDAPVRVPASA